MSRPSHLSLSPPFPHPVSESLSSSSAEAPQFPSSGIRLYNSVSLCIFRSGIPHFFPLLFLCLIPPGLGCHTLHLLPHLCFLFAHFLILMSFCITIVSFSFFPPHPKASLPLAVRPHPFAVCTHFHSLLFISTLALLPCHTLSFFFPFLFSPLGLFFTPPPNPPLLSHMLSSLTPLPSMLRWESHNASREEEEGGGGGGSRGGGGGGVPFLHSIHTSSGEEVRERCNVWRGENMWQYLSPTQN